MRLWATGGLRGLWGQNHVFWINLFNESIYVWFKPVQKSNIFTCFWYHKNTNEALGYWCATWAMGPKSRVLPTETYKDELHSVMRRYPRPRALPTRATVDRARQWPVALACCAGGCLCHCVSCNPAHAQTRETVLRTLRDPCANSTLAEMSGKPDDLSWFHHTAFCEQDCRRSGKVEIVSRLFRATARS